MFSKYALLLLLTVAFLGTGFARASEHAIYSYSGPDGKTLSFFVSDDAFVKTPEWVFDGKTPPPFSVFDAYPKALASVKARFPKITEFKMRSYTLQQAPTFNLKNRWYYTIDFSASLDGTALFGTGFTALVLMDGTTIEPREKE